jgi:hypothetical protein
LVQHLSFTIAYPSDEEDIFDTEFLEEWRDARWENRHKIRKEKRKRYRGRYPDAEYVAEEEYDEEQADEDDDGEVGGEYDWPSDEEQYTDFFGRFRRRGVGKPPIASILRPLLRTLTKLKSFKLRSKSPMSIDVVWATLSRLPQLEDIELRSKRRGSPNYLQDPILDPLPSFSNMKKLVADVGKEGEKAELLKNWCLARGVMVELSVAEY